MLNEKFVLIAVVTGLIGVIPYLRAMFRGEASPNRVSWFLWSAVPMIAFAAEWRQGVGFPAITTLLAGLNPLLVLIASFFAPGKALWKLGKFDYACGTCAILAIILWQISGEPNVGLAFSVIADGFASAPTVRKAWKYPQTENATPFLVSNVRNVLKLLTITSFTFASLAFVLYDLVLNNLIVSLILRKKTRK